jgi:hypothetical protein
VSSRLYAPGEKGRVAKPNQGKPSKDCCATAFSECSLVLTHATILASKGMAVIPLVDKARQFLSVGRKVRDKVSQGNK